MSLSSIETSRNHTLNTLVTRLSIIGSHSSIHGSLSHSLYSEGSRHVFSIKTGLLSSFKPDLTLEDELLLLTFYLSFTRSCADLDLSSEDILLLLLFLHLILHLLK